MAGKQVVASHTQRMPQKEENGAIRWGGDAGYCRYSLDWLRRQSRGKENEPDYRCEESEILGGLLPGRGCSTASSTVSRFCLAPR